MLVRKEDAEAIKTFIIKLIKADSCRLQDRPHHRLPSPSYMLTESFTHADLSSDECFALVKWMREWKIEPRSLFTIEELRHIEDMVALVGTNGFSN